MLRLERISCATVAAIAVLFGAAQVQAISIVLDVELDDGIAGNFARLEVSEEERGLLFDLVLLGPLGDDADMRVLYFNLVDGGPSLMLESDDDVDTDYILRESRSVAGGAGSDFDFEVRFGNGAGPMGNGVLQMASFLIQPSDPMSVLSLDALLDAEGTTASGGSIDLDLALHVQGTSLVWGSSSETVGGVVPEPATGMLLAAGLSAGLLVGRARSQL